MREVTLRTEIDQLERLYRGEVREGTFAGPGRCVRATARTAIRVSFATSPHGLGHRGVEMVVVSRTDDQPAGSRLDYWRHLVCDTLVPLDMSIEQDGDAPGDYCGRLRHTDLGVAQLVEMTASRYW
jgi:hypothetical protein